MGADGAVPRGFSLDVTAGDAGRTTVAVSGELDLVTAPAFKDAVKDALEAGPVLVDLGGLGFMDSAGVHALNSALAKAAQTGHELRVHKRMAPIVEQVLELTGMMALLPLEEDRA